ncbi:MAG: hypothetical protein UZ01_02777 [Candidatus Brocadia sinica]|nr:MAG: hypothetical protein UZ01_02777 [Candidatus Brocadia sinica]
MVEKHHIKEGIGYEKMNVDKNLSGIMKMIVSFLCFKDYIRIFPSDILG